MKEEIMFNVNDTVMVLGIIKEVIITEAGAKYKVTIDGADDFFKTVIVPVLYEVSKSELTQAELTQKKE